MADLLVVRHALAAAPDDLRLPGVDLSLRPEGRRQAEALAKRLVGMRPAAVWSSEARRARETAEIVAGRCGLRPGVRTDLRELDFGAWAGRTFAEVAATDPDAAGWFADPGVGCPPGGETAAAAGDRALAACADLAASAAGPVVVVGHAGSLRLALARALGVPLDRAWRLRLDCAGLSVLGWAAGGPTILGLNDTAHLDDAAGGPGVG
jgi:broad specificity phosphatase PhoE